MDTETGAEVLAVVKSWSIRVAVPVERGGGRAVFEFEHGAAYREHIERDDAYYVKALVQYNPYGDEQANALQRERLGELSRSLAHVGRRLLLELLVPATGTQLAALGEDRRRYRPRGATGSDRDRHCRAAAGRRPSTCVEARGVRERRPLRARRPPMPRRTGSPRGFLHRAGPGRGPGGRAPMVVPRRRGCPAIAASPSAGAYGWPR